MAEPARNYDTSSSENTSVFGPLAANYNEAPAAANTNRLPVSNVQKEFRTAPEDSQGSSTAKSTKRAGTAGQVAGTTVQAVGKTTKAVGTGITAAGTAVRVVPVVGTIAGTAIRGVGMGVRGAGKAVDKTGKTVRKGSTKVKRIGATTSQVQKGYRKNATVLSPTLNPVRRAQALRNTITKQKKVMANTDAEPEAAKIKIKRSASILFWLNVLLIMPVVGVFSALFVYSLDAYMTVQTVGITGIAKSAAWEIIQLDFTAGISEAAKALAATEFFMQWMVGFYLIGFFISMSFLLIAFHQLQSLGANTKGGPIKNLLFILAFIGAAFPVANAFPWAAFWLRRVKKKPL